MKIVRVTGVFLVAAAFMLAMLPSGVSAIEEKFDYRLQQKIEKAIKDLQVKEGTIKRKAKSNLIAWGSDAVEPLLAIVKDWGNQPEDLRVVCVEILGEIKDTAAVPVIITVLDDKRMTMRYTAAKALGSIGDNRATPDLIKLLKDSEGQVRLFTAEALGKIKDRAASKPLAAIVTDDPEDKVKMQALKALDSIAAKDEYPTVIKALSDATPDIRGYAAELLASWQVEEALPEIVKMLKDDRANTVRASCANAVGIYKNMSTFPALIQALGDEYKDVKIYALDSLKKMSGQNFEYDQAAWNHWFELNKAKAGN